MIGRRVFVKVDRRICGRLGKPGRMRTRGVELERECPDVTTSVEEPEVAAESFEAAAMKSGNPCDAVRAVRLSCFLS